MRTLTICGWVFNFAGWGALLIGHTYLPIALFAVGVLCFVVDLILMRAQRSLK